MSLLRQLLTLYLLILSATAAADVLVLVHGYLGNTASWIKSGVVQVLQERGHPFAGTYSYSASGVQTLISDWINPNAVYTVNLPSTAPIPMQADWLATYLDQIQARHPQTPITLIGHSAGGLAARLVVVRDHPANIKRLITIATPHLGTGRAAQALDATSSGLFGIKRWAVRRRTGTWLYNTLRASRGVFFDLLPPRPGTFLYWLNRQVHPDIEYISIIRNGTETVPGDWIVPPASQDMRQIAALRGKAHSFSTQSGHLLTAQDGNVLANLVADKFHKVTLQ